jgi:hypothetical protein
MRLSERNDKFHYDKKIVRRRRPSGPYFRRASSSASHDIEEGRVYQKPRVERFGSFRELTQVGFNGTTDGFTICGIGGGTGNELCGGPGAPPCRDGSPVSIG